MGWTLACTMHLQAAAGRPALTDILVDRCHQCLNVDCAGQLLEPQAALEQRLAAGWYALINIHLCVLREYLKKLVSRIFKFTSRPLVIRELNWRPGQSMRTGFYVSQLSLTLFVFFLQHPRCVQNGVSRFGQL